MLILRGVNIILLSLNCGPSYLLTRLRELRKSLKETFYSLVFEWFLAEFGPLSLSSSCLLFRYSSSCELIIYVGACGEFITVLLTPGRL